MRFLLKSRLIIIFWKCLIFHLIYRDLYWKLTFRPSNRFFQCDLFCFTRLVCTPPEKGGDRWGTGLGKLKGALVCGEPEGKRSKSKGKWKRKSGKEGRPKAREKGAHKEKAIWVSNSNDVLNSSPGVCGLYSGTRCWSTSPVPPGGFPPFFFLI